MGQYCCGDQGIKRDMEYNMKSKDDVIKNLKKPKDKQKQYLLSPNSMHNYEASPTPSSISMNSADINPNDDEYQPPSIDADTLLRDFEESIIDKDFQNAMALYEEYWNIDFKNHEFTNGDKALHYAIRQRNSKFAYFMLQKGADPNVKSRVTGDTPLHIATRNEDVRMITLLMKWKADLNIKNGADKSPYDIAIEKNNPDIIEMYDSTFQAFLQERGPTLHNYTRNSGVKVQIGKHHGAKKKIKSAWDVDDGGKDELKRDDITNKKQRKIWKPSADDEVGTEAEAKTQNEHRNVAHKTNITVTESEFEDESGDDESEQKGGQQINSKVLKMLGATKRTIENENDVSDILKKLHTEELNNDNNNAGLEFKADSHNDIANELSQQRKIGLVSDESSDFGDSNISETEMSMQEQVSLVEMSLGGGNNNNNNNRDSLLIPAISRDAAPSFSVYGKGTGNNPMDMRSKMKKIKGKQSKRVLTALGSIHQSEVQLPKLGTWLEKRRHKPPYLYQKRFLCVIDGHLLWNEKKIKISPNARMDSTERKKFSGSLSLMMVKDVYVHESKKKDTWKFEVIAYDTKAQNRTGNSKKERIYIWKTKTRQSRDNWVSGIKKHCDHLNNALDHFDNL